MSNGRQRPPHIKYLVMLAVGVVGALATGISGYWEYAPVAGWAAAALAFTSWVWLVIAGQDAAQTAAHATREDPSRTTSELLVLSASVASLGAVVFVIVQANSTSGAARGMLAALAVVSVSLSWLLIHTLYTLRYARMYYGAVDGGVEFNQAEPPRYTDFAYLAFTLGMTYQVSDTNLKRHDFRTTVLLHGLLSYLFGSVILATTINLVVGLSNR